MHTPQTHYYAYCRECRLLRWVASKAAAQRESYLHAVEHGHEAAIGLTGAP